MYLPPPIFAPGDNFVFSMWLSEQRHRAGLSSSNAQDAAVAASADTRWTHSPPCNKHDVKRLLLQVWEWAASKVTNWTKIASSISLGDNRDKTSSDAGPSVSLRKRTSSQDLNVTIGVVVGVLLGVFLLGTLAFCYVYRNSIRLKRKKKFQRQQRRHRSGGSHGSKSSKSSRSSASSAGGDGGGGGGDAEAAAPPAEGG